MRATHEVLEDHRVRLQVEVDEDEVEEKVASTARELARQVRIPGFRPGHAPRQVVEARLGGAKALRQEALRELVPDFYARALSEAELEPISSPELNVTDGEEAGPVHFDAVVEVRPEVQLTGHGSLRVTIPSPLATDDELEALLRRYRETDASLEEVARPIATGDYVTIDFTATDDEGNVVVERTDEVYPVGQGTIVDTADDQLLGRRAGETFEVRGTAPVGATLDVTITVKQVREQRLPELTDEWVQENTSYETVQELRDAALEQIRASKLAQARRAMREATYGELAGQVGDADIPEVLLDRETHDRAEELEHNLARSRITLDTYLSAMHLTVEQLLDMLRDDARTAIKVDLALRAVAQAEALEPSDAALDEELANLAADRKEKPEQLRDQLVRAGRMGSLRSALRKQMASDWVFERATFVDETGSVIDRTLLEEPPAEGSEPLDQSPAAEADDDGTKETP